MARVTKRAVVAAMVGLAASACLEADPGVVAIREEPPAAGTPEEQPAEPAAAAQLSRIPPGAENPATKRLLPGIPRGCAPSAGRTLWVEEGEKLTATLGCDTGAELAPGDLAMDALPDGARFDESTFTLSWTPGLDQAAVYELPVEVRATGERGVVRIGVADAFDRSGNRPLRSAESYTEEFGIPVVHLETDSISDEEYRKATIVYRGRTYAAEAKHRGRTSMKYPKKSFTLKFPGAALFSDAHKGFYNRKKVVLITNFNDNSSLRHRLGFDLWNAMDRSHLPVQTFSVVLYWNGRFHGIYTLADHIDDDYLALNGMPKEGGLYKAVEGDYQFSRASSDGRFHAGYEKKSGHPPQGERGAFDELQELLDVLASSSSSTFANLSRIANRQEFHDWWIFSTYIVGRDLVRKNLYLYREPGAGFRYIPWDLDGVFGQNYKTLREKPDTDSDFSGRNVFFERLMDFSASRSEVERRYAEMLKGPFAASWLHG
ncbi:MAG: CotH kinase family protein, partial [Myxococcales bacterium]